ncbi:hypothetical protein Tco_0312997 [Tanacetum coccineum]
MFNEGGEDCGFDSNEDEVVPKVNDVSLVDRVFEGAFGGDGDEDFVIGEGVVVSSSLLVKSTKSFLGDDGEDDEENEGGKNVAGSIEKIVNCTENQENTVKILVTPGGESYHPENPFLQPTLFPQESSKISKFANA